MLLSLLLVPQDSLSDWATALLFDKATEAAKAAKPGGRKGAGQAAAEDAMDWEQEGADAAAAGARQQDGSSTVFHELRPLLAAVSHVGSAAGACLGKLCAAMGAKKKLKAGAVARGLEALIAGESAGPVGSACRWGLTCA
jgi:hypothetical protein